MGQCAPPSPSPSLRAGHACHPLSPVPLRGMATGHNLASAPASAVGAAGAAVHRHLHIALRAVMRTGMWSPSVMWGSAFHNHHHRHHHHKEPLPCWPCVPPPVSPVPLRAVVMTSPMHLPPQSEQRCAAAHHDLQQCRPPHPPTSAHGACVGFAGHAVCCGEGLVPACCPQRIPQGLVAGWRSQLPTETARGPRC